MWIGDTDATTFAGSGGGWIAPSVPVAWVVGNAPGRNEMVKALAEAAGFAVREMLNVGDALARVADRPDGVLVFADFGDRFEDDESVLLALLDVQAADARLAGVVSFGRTLIDQVTACVTASHLTLLCEPSMAERLAAIEMTRAAPGGRVFAADGVTEAMKLQRLADEVARIARALAGLAEPDAEPRVEAVSDGLIGYRAGPVAPPSPSTITQPVRADDIRLMIRLRRQRDMIFAGDLFADPAWDMMLDLMAARIERLKVAVSSLCIAAAVPPTTALRWIRTLTDIGLFVRIADPNDRRRVFIELSDDAARLVLNFLGEAKHAGVAVV